MRYRGDAVGFNRTGGESFHGQNSDLQETSIIAELFKFVTTEVAEILKIAPNGGNEINEEPRKIVKPDNVATSDEKD